MSNMFKVEFAKLCYNKAKEFVSIYVTDMPLSSAKCEIKDTGESKTFWITEKEDTSKSGRKMNYIYPGTEAWEKFKPFRDQFLDPEDVEICEKHDE